MGIIKCAMCLPDNLPD